MIEEKRCTSEEAGIPSEWRYLSLSKVYQIHRLIFVLSWEKIERIAFGIGGTAACEISSSSVGEAYVMQYRLVIWIIRNLCLFYSIKISILNGPCSLAAFSLISISVNIFFNLTRNDWQLNKKFKVSPPYSTRNIGQFSRDSLSDR